MSNVLKFPASHNPTHNRTPPKRIGYPRTATMVCHDGELQLDPRAKTVQQVVAHMPPPISEPSIYPLAGEAVLDLGDMLEVRTLLNLTPDDAETWGRALIQAAKLARKQQQGE